PSGRPLDDPGGPPLLDAATLNRRSEWLAAARPAIEAPRQSGSGRWFVRMILPLDDSRIGWLVGELDVRELDSLLAGVNIGADGIVVALHESGPLVARHQDGDRYRASDMAVLTAPRPGTLDDGQEAAVYPGILDGIDRT